MKPARRDNGRWGAAASGEQAKSDIGIVADIGDGAQVDDLAAVERFAAQVGVVA